jgi:hypothetical protein
LSAQGTHLFAGTMEKQRGLRYLALHDTHLLADAIGFVVQN